MRKTLSFLLALVMLLSLAACGGGNTPNNNAPQGGSQDNNNGSNQPSGGAQGQATEIQIVAEKILATKKKLNEILAANTGQPYEVIQADTERDNYMSAEEAKAYGLIDEVIHNR